MHLDAVRARHEGEPTRVPRRREEVGGSTRVPELRTEKRLSSVAVKSSPMDDGGGPTAPAADRAAEEPEPAREAAAAFAAVVVPAVERVRQAGAGLAAAQAETDSLRTECAVSL